MEDISVTVTHTCITASRMRPATGAVIMGMAMRMGTESATACVAVEVVDGACLSRAVCGWCCCI